MNIYLVGRRFRGWLGLAAALGLSHLAVLAEPMVPASLNILAKQAGADDPKEAAAARQALRQAGPAGMQALSEVYADGVAQHRQNQGPGNAVPPDAAWSRVCAAFDAVGQQRDDYAAQLYWHTNLDQAITAARASGRPRLTLWLLGKLSDEYSCANSRFFRTTLYPNAEVSAYLRDHFILHWQSVRPVPRITIDMGDGRKIERTITGNSIHYILDCQGRPVDALPGLYGARAFLDGLGRALAAAQQSVTLAEPERREFLQQYHATELARVEQDWAQDLARLGVQGVDGRPAGLNTPVGSLSEASRLEAATSEETWRQIAFRHAEPGPLDPAALALIMAKQPANSPATPPDMAEAMRLTVSKMAVETPMMRMIRNLKHSIAEDTVRNEYERHARLHEWFAQGSVPTSLDALNARVYAEIFLTPMTDPWLGLAPADVYSALDRGGLVQNISTTINQP